MDAVDEGDNGGSLSRECKLPLEPLDRGSVGDSALNASPADLVRRSSAIFWRRSSGGSGGWLAMACFASSWFSGLGLASLRQLVVVVLRAGPVSRRCAGYASRRAALGQARTGGAGVQASCLGDVRRRFFVV